MTGTTGLPPGRRATKERATKETTISASLAVDGTGVVDVSTGLPFFDHMLEQLGRHASFDLTVHARGDLDVDAHHTVEDVGIVLGACLAEALGDKRGIRRFASMLLPLDEALIEVALDLSPPTRSGSGRHRSTRSWPRSSGAPSPPPAT